MLLNLYAVLVRRSMDTSVVAEVPRHEAELLRSVHGADGVALLHEGAPVGSFAVGAVFEERDRLAAKYGLKAPDVLWVDAVFPNDGALEKALAAGAVAAGDDEAEPEPVKPKRAGRAVKAADDATLV